jgi:thioesterase domain-containing protein
VAKATGNRDQILYAYYVPVNPIDNQNLEILLKDFLARILPDYMIPSFFIPLANIPLTINGKIDLKALPESNIHAGENYLPPRDEIETKLVEIWSEILLIKKEHIGIRENFFHLGGNSMGLVKMTSRILQAFDVYIPLHQVFAGPMIREIALYIKSGKYMDQPLVLLNKELPEKLFCFPPGSGWAIAYYELAKRLTDQSVYAFNYIEEEDRLSQYLDIMTGIQPGRPFVLLGYSAGGILCFQVARALENAGYDVSDIILVDSFLPVYQTGVHVKIEVEDFFRRIEEALASLGAEILKDKVKEKTAKYIEYCNSNIRLEKIRADIHLILSEAPLDIGAADSQAWEKFTTGKTTIYRGFGKHPDMLSPGALEKNMEIIRQILKQDLF